MHEGQKLHILIQKDERGLNEIAALLNVAEATIIRWYKEEKLRTINKARLKIIGIDLDALEDVNKKHDLNHIAVAKNNAILAAHKLPLYDVDAMAGNMMLFSESNPEYIIDWVDLPALRNATACIGVMGDSMYPTYKRGDIIVLKEIFDYAKDVEYGQAYVIVTNESLWLKRIDKHKIKNTWHLRSDNKAYGIMEVDQKKVVKLYRVRGTIRIDNF